MIRRLAKSILCSRHCSQRCLDFVQQVTFAVAASDPLFREVEEDDGFLQPQEVLLPPRFVEVDGGEGSMHTQEVTESARAVARTLSVGDARTLTLHASKPDTTTGCTGPVYGRVSLAALIVFQNSLRVHFTMDRWCSDRVLVRIPLCARLRCSCRRSSSRTRCPCRARLCARLSCAHGEKGPSDGRSTMRFHWNSHYV